MTVNRMKNYIGQQGLYHHDGMDWSVHVLDVKFEWGKLRLKITPQAGHGSKWVDESSVSFGNGY